MSCSAKKKLPVICCGVAGIIGMAILTGFTVDTVVNKANDDADQAFAEAVTLVHNAQMDEWRAEQDRLAQLEAATLQNSTSAIVTEYSVDDIIMVDGKWYVISTAMEQNTASSVVNGNADTDNVTGNNGDMNATNPAGSDNTADTPGVTDNAADEQKPIVVDPSNAVIIDGVTYVTISNPDDIEELEDIANTIGVDSVDNFPYVGTEYVTIDADGTLVYHVIKNDTLTEISNRTGFSVQELAEYNCIKNVNLIYTDQSIRIPASQKIVDYVAQIQSVADKSNQSEDTTESENSETNE